MYPTSPKNRASDVPSEVVWIKLVEQEVTSAVASVDFTTLIDDSFKEYVFKYSAVIPSSDPTDLIVRTSADGVTFDAGANDYIFEFQSEGTSTNSSAAGVAFIQITGTANVGGGAGEEGVNGTLSLFRPSDALLQTVVTFSNMHYTTNNVMESIIGGGFRRSTAVVQGFRFLFSAGNIESGMITMYGVKP